MFNGNDSSVSPADNSLHCCPYSRCFTRFCCCIVRFPFVSSYSCLVQWKSVPVLFTAKVYSALVCFFRRTSVPVIMGTHVDPLIRTMRQTSEAACSCFQTLSIQLLITASLWSTHCLGITTYTRWLDEGIFFQTHLSCLVITSIK